MQEMYGDQIHFNSNFEKSKKIPNTCNFSIRGRELPGKVHLIFY